MDQKGPPVERVVNIIQVEIQGAIHLRVPLKALAVAKDQTTVA